MTEVVITEAIFKVYLLATFKYKSSADTAKEIEKIYALHTTRPGPPTNASWIASEATTRAASEICRVAEKLIYTRRGKKQDLYNAVQNLRNLVDEASAARRLTAEDEGSYAW